MQRRHLVSWALLAIGLGVVGYYVYALGPDRLLFALRSAGFGLALLFTLPLYLYVVHTFAWRLTLSRKNRRDLGLFRLIVLQTFSYGISGMLPLQMFIAEPLKMAILKDVDYDKEDFAASLLLNNTINGFAIVAFATAGLCYLGLVLETSLVGKLVALGFVALMIVLGAGLIAVQKRGVFAGSLALLGRIASLRAVSERHRAQAERIDDVARAFYQHDRAGFYLCFLLHCLERAFYVAEFWLVFHLMDQTISWGSAFFIASVVTSLDNLLFFAQVGGMETWISSLLAWMQLTRDSINITAALFRRLRMVFWALMALLLVPATRRFFAASTARRAHEPRAPA
jgi:hypothetical protein